MVKILTALMLISTVVNGQRLVFSAVEKLPLAINTDAEEIAPFLSPDGMTLYFTRLLDPANRGGKFAGSDVYMSRYDVTTLNWKAPENLMSINTKGNNILIGLNSKGDQLYTLATSANKVPLGFYVSKRVNGVLGKPELVPISKLQSDGFIGAYLTPDQDVLIVSMEREDSRGEEDLYISVKSGNAWSSLVNMGSSINTKGFEIAPFLSADKKRLFFSSNGHPGSGSADIFYCDRLYNSWEAWTSPVNVGEPVNSVGFDAYFSLYGDTLAVFSSTRTDRSEGADVYKARVSYKEMLPEIELDSMEVRELFGQINQRIIFNKSSTTLTAANREFLWYIGNKLIDHKGIRLRIVSIDSETDKALIDSRVEAIQSQLANTGLEGSRIQRVYRKMQTGDDINSVVIMFVKNSP